MDVKLQILKYLKRSPKATVSLDDLFPEVRSWHWFRCIGKLKTMPYFNQNADRIVNSCAQDIPTSKIPNLSAGTTLVVK